jgi:hypothetical protein
MPCLRKTQLPLEFEFSTVAMQFISSVKSRKLSRQAKDFHLDALYACLTKNPKSLETNQSLQIMVWSIDSHQDANTRMEVQFITMTMIYQRICMEDSNSYHGYKYEQTSTSFDQYKNLVRTFTYRLAGGEWIGKRFL